jgi:hypothetical protein
MKNTIEYDGTEPQVVTFPQNIKAFINENVATIYTDNSLYPQLNDQAQIEICDRLWQLDFVEEIQIESE